MISPTFGKVRQWTVFGLFAIAFLLVGAVTQIDYNTQIKNPPFVTPAKYDFFAQTPGGSLASGNNTITMTPVPQGVNGTDSNHYLYVSGGTGTAEACLITGGSGTGGSSSGSIIINCANTHTGAWTIQSATHGAEEAFVACAGPCEVRLPVGNITWQGPLGIPAITSTTANHYTLRGQGRQTTRINISSTFPTGATGTIIVGFDGNSAHQLTGPYIADLGVIYIQPYGSALSSFTHWPPTVYSAGPVGTSIHNLYVSGAWTGFLLHGFPATSSACTISTGQFDIDDVWMSAYNVGIDIDCTFDINRIHKFHFWPFTDIFGTIANQGTFATPSVLGVSVGAQNGAEGVSIDDSLFISGTGVVIYAGALDTVISHTFFDFGSGVKIGGTATFAGTGTGNVLITGGTFYDAQSAVTAGYSGASCDHPEITFGSGNTSPGELVVANSIFYRACVSQPVLKVNNYTVENANFQQMNFENNLVYDTTNSTSASSLFNLIGGSSAVPLGVNIIGNQISYVNNLAYTNPMLTLTGTNQTIHLNFSNNQNMGLGSGTWLSIANDGAHRIVGNLFSNALSGAWTNSLPTSRTFGTYEDVHFEYHKSYPVYAAATSTTTVTGLSGFYPCNATSAGVTFNLPAVGNSASGFDSSGAEYVFKKTDSSANTCTITAAGADAIDGAASKTLTTQYQTLRIKAGTAGSATWYVE